MRLKSLHSHRLRPAQTVRDYLPAGLMTDPGTGPIAFRYEAAVFSLGLSRGPAAAEASSGATAPALLTAHSLALRTLAGESLLMAQVNKAVSNQEPIQKVGNTKTLEVTGGSMQQGAGAILSTINLAALHLRPRLPP